MRAAKSPTACAKVVGDPTRPVAPPLADFLPRTFLFFPARPELSERAAFVAEFERRAAEDAASNVWILKPSDGGKGARILVMAELDPILAHLDGLPFAGKGSVAWVVSEYITAPLLLPGRRQFDVRARAPLSPDFCPMLATSVSHRPFRLPRRFACGP